MKELKSWKYNTVYMSTKLHLTSWVCSIIEKNQGPVPKAHLVVAREFEDHSQHLCERISIIIKRYTENITVYNNQ